MDIAVDYQVVECGNSYQHSIKTPFHTFSSAKAFADQAQAKADARGNPRGVTYHVLPKGNVMYSTQSQFPH
ncbi:MAG: hypothetical protein MI751_07765 [Pseudomonadales bacterium]|nr:hypothetical protein [Pseudomonadales bacterium]